MKKFIIPIVVTVIIVAGFWFPTINQAEAQSSQSIADQLNLLQNLMKQVLALQEQFRNLQSQNQSQSTVPATPATPTVPGTSPAIPATPAVPSTIATPSGFVVLDELPGDVTIPCFLPSNLDIGSKNNSVYFLQKVLNDSGYYPEGLITGYYGKLTRKAVNAFKSANANSDLNSLVKKYYPKECGEGGETSAPSITVLSPNGGEVWQIGKNYGIKWVSSGLQNNNKIYIDLVKPSETMSGGSFATIVARIATNITDTGIFSWTIPQNIPLASNYKILIENEGGEVLDKSDSYFKIVSSSTNPPVISGISGPQSLNVNQMGTWTVNASDSSGGNLSYSVIWGDEVLPQCSHFGCPASSTTSQQSATFTHTYSFAAAFNPTFTVTNSSGQSAKTSLSVNVGSTTTTNHNPVLGLIAVPTSIQVGQSVNFNFSATDADNDDLGWSLSWGDNTPIIGSTCSSSGNKQTGAGWTWNGNHTWNTAGTYNVKVSVSDCRGGTADTSFSVNVGSTVTKNSVSLNSANVTAITQSFSAPTNLQASLFNVLENFANILKQMQR